MNQAPVHRPAVQGQGWTVWSQTQAHGSSRKLWALGEGRRGVGARGLGGVGHGGARGHAGVQGNGAWGGGGAGAQGHAGRRGLGGMGAWGTWGLREAGAWGSGGLGLGAEGLRCTRGRGAAGVRRLGGVGACRPVVLRVTFDSELERGAYRPCRGALQTSTQLVPNNRRGRAPLGAGESGEPCPLFPSLIAPNTEPSPINLGSEWH